MGKGDALMKVLEFVKARLNERSTYMFVISSLGTVSACPSPFNYIGGVLLFLAAFVPDNDHSE